MLGFGFNKTKVLATAEKYVQQGKLQNAITEYEKITKADPKDITVLNTIGDLYARLGQVDSAVNYFRMVGDHYASEGFTVKAIAMYKKLTKLNPSELGMVQKLAELYMQQGLYNDARQQFMIVAESHIKGGGLDEACKVFQKMLELDPENAGLQAKLADLYMRTGKKDEAKNIFLNAAEALHQRGTLDAASEALAKVLKLEPTNTRALLLNAQIAYTKGDLEHAIKYFEQIPDLDSRPDALKSVLEGSIKLGKLESAEPTAKKLLNVHHDVTGMKMYADALLAGGKVNEAIGVYQEFSDQLIAANGQAVVQALNSYISRVKDDPSMLELLNSLFQKAGDSSHSAEIKELLAHASVQKGDLARARDLYKELATIEPENPLHNQNYKQILTRMGEDSTSRELTSEEGSQALMVEELENAEVLIEQHYTDLLATALQTALTEADLYESYNAPHKAVGPLEAVLGRAPQDVRINQRLAALYARLNRPADASQRCAVLEKVFSAAGLPQEALKYGEMAAKYAEIAGVPVPKVEALTAEQVSPAAPPIPAPTFSIEPEVTTGKVEEFDFDAMPAATAAPAPEAVPAAETSAATEQEAGAVQEFEVPSTAAHQEAIAHEIDLSDEWETMMGEESAPVEPTVVVPEVVAAPQPETVRPEPEPEAAAMADQELVDEFEPDIEIEVAPPPAEEIPELVVEAASAHAIEPEPAVAQAPPVAEPKPAPAEPEIVALPQPVAAPEPVGAAGPEPEPQPAFEVATEPEPAGEPEPAAAIDDTPLRTQIDDMVEEIQFYIAQKMWSEASAALEKLDFLAPNLALIDEFQAQITAGTAPPPAPEVVEPVIEPPKAAETPALAAPEPEIHAEPIAPAATIAEPEPILDLEEPVLEESVLELPEEEEPGLGLDTTPASPPAPKPQPAVAAASHDMLSDFVHDLDESLGEDFAIGGKSAPAAPKIVPPPPQPAPVPVPAIAASIAAPAVAAAAPPPVSQMTAAATETIDISEGTALLQDLFEEFKEDVEEGSAQTEDPETHYNLGVAFKEMGLLDEAIGELQKVSQAIDRGQPFSQSMQAYTWLANCFLEKGVPEASFKWYQKALTLAQDDDTRTAINYELACAYESAGMKAEALKNFMEVYTVNIDFRDVSDRIKSLKQS